MREWKYAIKCPICKEWLALITTQSLNHTPKMVMPFDVAIQRLEGCNFDYETFLDKWPLEFLEKYVEQRKLEVMKNERKVR